MAYLVLLDIPKHRVQLDLATYPVGGGFRGFQNVLPGYHFLRIWGEGAEPRQLEVWPKSQGEAIGLREVGGALALIDGPEAEELNTRAPSMAGALIDALAKHDQTAFAWQTATSAIDQPVHQIKPGVGRGFDALFARHAGDRHATLRELQAVFVRVVLHDDASLSDRLVDLLQAHFGAGERRVSEQREYFVAAANSIAGMLRAVPAFATPGARTVAQAELLVEDLADVGETSAAAALRTALNR